MRRSNRYDPFSPQAPLGRLLDRFLDRVSLAFYPPIIPVPPPLPEGRFPAGKTLGTRGALAALRAAHPAVTLQGLYQRHFSGRDWGEWTTTDQWRENDAALAEGGGAITSHYGLPDGGQVVIWTVLAGEYTGEGCTLVMLPDE